VRRCEEYVDSLMEPPRPAAQPAPVDEKEIAETPEETERWLQAFGGQPGR
jgi:hypothetical protein